jgi:hypothetical protein
MVYSLYKGRDETMQILARIYELLEDQSVTVNGWLCGRLFVDNENVEQLNSGRGWKANTTYSLWMEKDET